MPPTLIEQLRAAVLAHAAWKARLAEAIQSGTSNLSLDVVRRDDQCAFGKWLHVEIDPMARRAEHYERVRALHATFHIAAAHALGLAVSGRTAEALAATSPGSEFLRTSNQLTAALTAWQQSLGS